MPKPLDGGGESADGPTPQLPKTVSFETANGRVVKAEEMGVPVQPTPQSLGLQAQFSRRPDNVSDAIGGGASQKEAVAHPDGKTIGFYDVPVTYVPLQADPPNTSDTSDPVAGE